MYWFLYIITWPLIRLVFPCRLKGNKKILKTKRPQIILCNHLSNIDVIYIGSYFNYRLNFLAKKEMFKNKILGWVFKKIGCIPVDRDKISIESIKKCLSILKADKRLVMFPEGTRNKVDESLQEIKNGAAMFAIKTNAIIIPMHIEKRPKAFRMNSITIGEAFDLEQFEGKASKENLMQASAVIEENMQKLY